MRRVLALGLGLGVLALCAGAAAAQSYPARKPGLWKQSMVAGGRAMETSMCIDAATDRKLSAFGQQAGANCASMKVAPAAGGWTFNSVCTTPGGGQTATRGTARGDFSRRYTVKATSVTTGARMGMMNGTHAIDITATWAGACPAGVVPGDMMMPGGIKMNVLKMTAR